MNIEDAILASPARPTRPGEIYLPSRCEFS